MRRYEMKGGGTFEAASAIALVEAMRLDSKSPTESTAHYMKEVADRCKLQNGATIRTGDPESFIADLQQHGFLLEMAQ